MKQTKHLRYLKRSRKNNVNETKQADANANVSCLVSSWKKYCSSQWHRRQNKSENQQTVWTIGKDPRTGYFFVPQRRLAVCWSGLLNIRSKGVIPTLHRTKWATHYFSTHMTTQHNCGSGGDTLYQTVMSRFWYDFGPKRPVLAPRSPSLPISNAHRQSPLPLET